jgi:hypothetical protein
MANKKRLIDANVLKTAFESAMKSCRSPFSLKFWSIALKAVNDCPTIDAVPVVRCKDCEYYALHALACRHDHMNGVMPIDGYCSNGKRRSHHDSLCDQTEEG